MITFIAFALVVAGCINWLLIGLLQYDFVAGIFGYQGSVFSRIIYIIVGAAAVYLVVRMFMDKGAIYVWGGKKKRLARQREEYRQMQAADIEASRESIRRRDSGYREKPRDDYYDDYRYDDRYNQSRGYDERRGGNLGVQDGSGGLFDEHFDQK